MSRQVRGPDGRSWTVARRWTKRRVRWRRWRDRTDGSGWWVDVPAPLGDLAELSPVLAVVAAVVALVGIVALGIFVVIPALLALVDLLLLLAVVAGVVGTKIVLRRPWEVEAHTEQAPSERRSWGVVGWKASGRAVDEVAQRIEAGVPDPGPVDATR